MILNLVRIQDAQGQMPHGFELPQKLSEMPISKLPKMPTVVSYCATYIEILIFFAKQDYFL